MRERCERWLSRPYAWKGTNGDFSVKVAPFLSIGGKRPKKLPKELNVQRYRLIYYRQAGPPLIWMTSYKIIKIWISDAHYEYVPDLCGHGHFLIYICFICKTFPDIHLFYMCECSEYDWSFITLVYELNTTWLLRMLKVRWLHICFRMNSARYGNTDIIISGSNL